MKGIVYDILIDQNVLCDETPQYIIVILGALIDQIVILGNDLFDILKFCY